MNNDFYKYSSEEVEQLLKTNRISGLTKVAVLEQQNKTGKNLLKTKRPKNFFQKFIEQIGDFMVLTLLGAAIISLILGEKSEAILIIIIVILNATLGIIQENKAEKALDAIKKMSSPHAKVIRDNNLINVLASDLVRGDIVLMEAGDYVPADIRLFEVHGLKVDESALTGESIPVEKTVEAIKLEEIPLGDMTNCVFMGTAVTYGRSLGMVVRTGMNTEIGKIAKMIDDVDYIQTPIQKSLDRFGKVLLIVIILICVFIFMIGVKQKQNYLDLFINVVSLAVAAIPEGLPAIVTIILAIGMQRLVKRNALIRKLPAVETLGSTDVICTDKTGTLTENKMTITNVYLNHTHYDVGKQMSNAKIKYLAVWGLLCNNTRIVKENDHYRKFGDPTDVAFVDLALKLALDPIKINEQYTRIYEIPFASERKLMSTVNMIKNKKIVITKGAPEVIFSLCKQIIVDDKVVSMSKTHLAKLINANEIMTKKALRVIAIGYREITDIATNKEIEKDLTFVGLVGMIDPPRKEVYESIRICKNAGIQTIMITGDHKNTAIAIARQLNIISDEGESISGHELDKLSEKEFKNNIDKYHVYARVSPEHKVRIVKTWQEKKKIVAMTGDGVNDAPALKNADIGIAMGIQGTEVAKGAADMILTDDNFATIVKAVEEGRTIFTNIKKAIKFLISCNIGEVITILLGALLGQFLFGYAVTPLNAVQLLWVNLTTDSLIAIAIGLEKSEHDVMKKKTQDKTLLNLESFMIVLFHGILIGLLAFIAFHIGFNMGTDKANSILIGQTMAFMTLTTCELFHAFNVRSERYSLFKIGVFTNPYIIYAFIFSLLLQYGVLIFPFTRNLFDITVLSPKQIIIIFLLSIVPIIVIEIGKVFNREKNGLYATKYEKKYLTR
jgi:Ca2+-transporting ATPase